MATLRHTKFFQEIQANPQLRDALMDAAKVLQEEGALAVVSPAVQDATGLS